MKGLSEKFEIVLNDLIEGLNDDINIDGLRDDEVNTAMASKLAAFKSAKKILHKWISSPNAPSKDKITKYAKALIDSGYKGAENLMEAFGSEIDYKSLPVQKRKNVFEAKPVIVDAIWELEGMIKELEAQSESESYNFIDKEFKIGYPERFAKGEFYPIDNYFKKWENEEEEAIRICPHGSSGKIIKLSNLKIQLPRNPTGESKILFSEYPKKEQYWRRIKPPDITKENVDSYTDFILEEFRRRREGVFFKNNGETFYLTGNHYFALQWCKIYDIKKPNGENYMDFRESQMNFYYHMQACLIDPRCLGQLFVKSRRQGYSYMVMTCMINEATSVCNSMYGMTSKTEDDAVGIFKKMAYMFKNLPFYFKPVVRGSEDSRKEIEFGKPLDRSKETKKSGITTDEDYLNTIMDYRATTEGAYDSTQLKFYFSDEFAKWTKDYVKHFRQITPTMMPGGRIVGKAFLGSTIGKEGLFNAKSMYYSSDVLKRNTKTGMTDTGLYSYFIPAQENYEGFIDNYGKCWTTTPITKTYNIFGKKITIGSNEYLDAKEESAKAQSQVAYEQQKRDFPRNVEDAFRSTDDICVFNKSKIYEQLTYNERLPQSSLYSVGNFEWKDGKEDGEVVFRPNPYGRFKVAWMPSSFDETMHLQNGVREVNGKFYPLNKELGVAGCDPFSLGGKKSDGSRGAIHGLTHKITPDGVPRNKFLFEYNMHESDTVFFEDVIKVIRFYGIPILVEHNRIDLLRHMYNRGYRYFALNRLDKAPASESEKKYGGQMMSGESVLTSHMNILGSWIDDHIGCSTNPSIRPLGEMGDFPFSDTLNDWLAFDPDNRTKHDLTVSSGLATMAINKDIFKKKQEIPKVKIVDFVKQYDYKDAVISW